MLKYNATIHKRKGFTLLELIVVIVILGILAAIAIPTFNTATNKTYNASTAATVAAMLKDTAALAGVSGRTTFEKADFENALKETSVFNGGYVLNAGITPQTSWSQATVNGVRKVGITFYKNGIATTDTSGTQLDTAVVVDNTKHCVFGRLNGNVVQTWTVEKDLGSNCAGSMLSSIVGPPNGGGGGGGITPSTGTLPVTVLPYVAPDATPPTAPTVSTGLVGLYTADINWTASTDASGIDKYVVKYIVTGAPAGTVPSEVTLSSTTFTTKLTNLKAASSYAISVEAYDKWGNKAANAPLAVVTSSAIYDDFDRTGALGATSGGSVAWQTLSGSWTTDGARAVASSTPAVAVVEAGVSNTTVQLTTSTATSAGDDALVMRASSNGDMLRARTERSSSTSSTYYGSASYVQPSSYKTCSHLYSPTGDTYSLYYTNSTNAVCVNNRTGSWFLSQDVPSGGYYHCPNGGNLSGTECYGNATTVYQTLLVLESVSGGTPTSLGSKVVSTSAAPGSLRAILSGDQIKVYTSADPGTPAVSVTSSFNQSATMFGIGRAAGSQSGLQTSGLDSFTLML